MARRMPSRSGLAQAGSAIAHLLPGIKPKLAVALVLASLLPGSVWAADPLAWKIPVPQQLLLEVRETAGIARSNEVVRSGVPLARSLNIRSTGSLAVVDAANRPVPAEFRVLARWNAGREVASAPIQWLLVIFPASVEANGRVTYRLVTDGSAGAPPSPQVWVSLRQTGNQISINTGAAIFTLGGSPGALFDAISLASGARLASAGDLTVTVAGRSYNHPQVRSVRIEYAGKLQAVVVLEGAYAMPDTGGGGLGSLRRYVFSAGSPTAIVRQAVNWEGDLAGLQAVNGLLVTQVRDTLALNLTGPLALTAIGNFALPALTGTALAGSEAWVRQTLRAHRLAPLNFEVRVPGRPATGGPKADGGVLAVGGNPGTVAEALNHMHRYEPQALRLLANGRLATDVVDNSVWLGCRQGLFATLAVSALPGKAARGELDRLVWAPLNRPLRAWPQAAWFASSNAVDEFPLDVLPPGLAKYDTLLARLMSDTLSKIDAKGLPGLMTFGVYPRYWGNPLGQDELDCGGATPSWDSAYWCGTWTDYHNTVATVPIWAMRAGDTRLLDELAFPGALRTLHTQIMQCSADDPYFYCGQAPAGYGGYRADFNSSHAYFDNLFLYYWLTGDSTVVETLKRGACSMRNFLCSRRPAQACLPDDLPADVWARLAGRVASQWFAAFRFVGLASSDASYLEDWRSGLARAVTQHYVAAQRDGNTYGFWLNDDTRVGSPGTYDTAQLWMASLYDMNNLYRLMVETEDAPLGNPPIAPSQVLAAWARTLARFGASTAGDGTAGGRWPERLTFTWSGSRLGGTLTSVAANVGGSDPYLYDTTKATLTATLVRAADFSGEGALRKMGEDLTALGLAAAVNDLSPLGKIMGLYLARLPAAVARLGHPQAPPGISSVYLLLLDD